MRFSTVAIVLIFFLSNGVFGQMAKPIDSSFVYAARSQATALYERTVKMQAHVYEGNQYINHDPRIKIHPYYVVDSLQVGTVVYKGIQYRDVAMIYDIVRDELVVQPPGGGYRLRLETDKISAFSLGPHRFARIVGDSVAGIRTGFYEIIYNGKAKALAKRLKTIHEDISGGTYKGDYLQKDRYIIQKDGAFYEVKSKRSVLNLFPDQAKELRKYARANRLKFNDEKREVAISRITQRYDELTR
ncbi:hypothetical protein [Spirosoma validum]|uniref:Uncharacterized protein n=1 Tax=Spirosoma validum TaxID=2771355 RepID=A0A927GGX1_9BACT|nr:hypothetical protein [Spirosoma validum]MBD2757329.1 hypothetical protein [Spirosoma validum]